MTYKILHIGESIFGGGAESVLRDTFNILKNKDDQNEHFLMVRKSKEKKSGENTFFFSVSPKGKLGASISQIYSVRNLKKLQTVLNKLTPDIIHLQNYGNLSPSILKAIYKYKKNNYVKVVHTVHTFEYVCSHHAGYDYRKAKKCTDCSKDIFKFKIFYRGCSRLGYMHSFGKGITNLIAMYYLKKGVVDQWITPSFFLRSKMSDISFLKNKIEVVRNPYIIDKYFKEENNNKNEGTFRYVYFGRFSEEKNVECIIKAFRLLLDTSRDKKFELFLIGTGEKEKDLRSLVSQLSLKENVVFFGFMKRDELNMKLKACNVSVLSSKCFENAPMIVMESILNNLIPIVVNHGGMKEMRNEVDFGYVFKDNDQEDLASQMYRSYKEYEKMISGISDKKFAVLREFGENNYFFEIKNIYEKSIK